MWKNLNKFISFIFLMAVIFIASNVPTFAHPEPLVVQEFLFDYGQNEIKMNYHLRLDPIVAGDVYSDFDTNKDGQITEIEAKAFFENILLKNLTSRLNNRDIQWEYQSSQLPKKEQLKSLNNYIEISLKAKDPRILETNSIYVKYNKKYFPDDPYGDYFNYEDKILINSEIERINIDQTNPAGTDEYSTDFKFKNFSGTSSESKTTEKPATTDSNPKSFFEQTREYSTKLTRDVRDYDFSSPFTFFLAVIVLFIAGALHAITPGHGKSMVAAFLIGKKESKAIDVLILGAAITLAHTAVIFIIGFVLLAINKTSQATQIVTIIEKISAWLFLGLGILLFYNGYKAYRHYKHHQDGHSHDHDHHGHHHDHDHHHGPKNLKIRNRWDLFYAGISGGIVPCIDALSILFIFTSIGKIELGIVLVFVFSLGLAAAIILLGLSLLYGKNKLNLEEKIGAKAEFLLPFISGSIIALIGIFYILSK